VGLLTFVIWQNWPALSAAIEKPLQPGMLAIALVLYFFAIGLTFVRWYVLVRAQELPFTLWNALRLGMVGYFLSTFLPGSIGGDIVKAAFLAKEQSRRTVAVATVLIDRVIGLLGLFYLVAITGSIFYFLGDPCLENRTLRGLLIASLGVVAGSIITWILAGLLPEWRAQKFAGRLENIPKVGHSFAELWRAAWMYRSKFRYVAGSLALALVAQVGMVIGFFAGAHVFVQPEGPTPTPSVAEHFLIVPVGLTVAALAPVPGGAGVGELGFGALYYLVLGTKEAEARGVLASLVARVIAWILGIVGFLFYLVMKPSLPHDTEREGESTVENSFTANGSVPTPAPCLPTPEA
jgi:glycosyltransferase 2 family protein